MYRMLRLLILVCMLFCVSSCDKGAGHRGVAANILESKGRGVFVAEYTVVPNPYIINDSLRITVTEAWLERQWAYSKIPDKVIEMDGFQLCINTKESDLKDISFNWVIGLSGDKYLRESSETSLISDLEKMPIGDTISYYVQKGRNLSGKGDIEIIGKFILLKKRYRQK